MHLRDSGEVCDFNFGFNNSYVQYSTRRLCRTRDFAVGLKQVTPNNFNFTECASMIASTYLGKIPYRLKASESRARY